MNSTICFVGGIHGAGKTTLCTDLSKKNGWLLSKQKYLILDIAKGLGKEDWQNAAPLFYNSVELAGELMVSRLLKSSSRIGMIDCHYAIGIRKALRPFSRADKNGYISDLDPTFVEAFKKAGVRLKFAFVGVRASVAIGRFVDRPAEHLGYENTLAGLEAQEQAERSSLQRLLADNSVLAENILYVTNEGSKEGVIEKLEEFIKRPS